MRLVLGSLALLLGTFACGLRAEPEGESASALEEADGVCANDLPDLAAAPGALDVYFSMPDIRASEVPCRTVASGRAPPRGRLALALWQMGPAAADTPVAWRVGDVTGFALGDDSELESWQRGPNDQLWTSAAQLRGSTVGMWINSGSSGVTHSGDILPVVAHYDFLDGRAPKPFAGDGELSYAFDAQIPTSQVWGGGVPYAAAVFRFKDTKPGSEGREVWFSMVFFDPRGAPSDGVMIDGCSTCSGYPILMTSISPARRFGSLGPGSAVFSSTTWRGFRHFDFRVARDQFGAAIAQAKQTFQLDDQKLSPDPADYALIHFNLNPEVYAPPGGGGTIGLSAKNITIARYPRPPARSIDRVVINAANGSRIGELQVFFKTATDDAYDERKSIRVPFPLGGGNHDVVADFSRHPDFRGTLTGIRVDPFDSRAPDACFNVDSVTLADATGRATQVWTFDGASGTPVAPFYEWRFSGLDRLWNDGRYWGACQSDGDPYFVIDLNLETGR